MRDPEVGRVENHARDFIPQFLEPVLEVRPVFRGQKRGHIFDDNDLWLENLVEQPWSQSIRWLSLNRNPAVTARGVETLALGLPKLQFASMNGVGNDPIASDEGYLPALGEALEVKAKREIVWLRRKFWIAGVIPPTPLQFLDLPQSQGAASSATGVF